MQDLVHFADTFELCEELRNKTFLITGITGLLGSITVKCLIALSRKFNLKIHVIGIVRDMQKAKALYQEYNEISLVCWDLNKIHELPTDVDYIIHYASPTASLSFVESPIDVYNTITHTTESILKYAKSRSVQSVVYASSLEVYGTIELKSEKIDEAKQGYIDPLSARSSYPMGKRSAEFLCYAYYKQHSIPVKIARLSQTFGAGVSLSDNRVFAQFARSVIENRDIVLNSAGLSSKSYCYITDAVSAVLYILIKGQNGEAYNIANPETYISIKDMAVFVRDNFAPNINIEFVYDPTKGYAPDTWLNLDITKVQELGWKPTVDLYSMYDRLIRYYKDDSIRM